MPKPNPQPRDSRTARENAVPSRFRHDRAECRAGYAEITQRLAPAVERLAIPRNYAVTIWLRILPPPLLVLAGPRDHLIAGAIVQQRGLRGIKCGHRLKRLRWLLSYYALASNAAPQS
jgi:hypothetical protein